MTYLVTMGNGRPKGCTQAVRPLFQHSDVPGEQRISTLTLNGYDHGKREEEKIRERKYFVNVSVFNVFIYPLPSV